MATVINPYISVDEYLKTVYRPDCDYVDGMIEERNLGEIDHGTVQARLARILGNLLDKTGLHVMTEVRMQVAQTRYRVPDLMLTRGKPAGRVVTSPPLLCIEILSPEDRIARVNTRIQEFLNFGVPNVWLIDPETRRLWIYSHDSSIQETIGSAKLEGTDIEIPFSEIFD